MNSREWQRAGLAMLTGLALLAPAARAANDDQQNKPKKDTSLRIMPLSRDRGFGTDPDSVRINPLSGDRVFTRPPRAMIFATEPRDIQAGKGVIKRALPREEEQQCLGPSYKVDPALPERAPRRRDRRSTSGPTVSS